MSFKKHISLLKEAIPRDEYLDEFEDISKELAKEIVFAAHNNNLVLILGNGGSATDASHWSSELVSSYENRFRDALPVISLTESLSTITAIANDDSYQNIFLRQVEAYKANLGIVIGLSTSGKSENVLRALDRASSLNTKTVLITGLNYPHNGRYSNEIIFNSDHVGTIQTLTQIFYHSVCNEVENLII